MAFVTDKQELKPGRVIFRQSDVQRRKWYCHVKLPKEDRYTTTATGILSSMLTAS
jgi:hypothetical protein